MTSKQRAYLRGLANGTDTVLTVGKNGINHNVSAETDAALEAHELVKGHVLEASPLTAREAAEQLALENKAQVVQVIGTRFVLYRQSKKPKIELPQ